MKATGIIRRVDDLGRVAIPKEIRRNMRIREGDPLELFVDNEGIVFKKYSPMGELHSFAQQHAEALSINTNLPVLIFDKDYCIAVSGASKKAYLNQDMSKELDYLLGSRKTYILQKDEPTNAVYPIDKCDQNIVVAAPIMNVGEVYGVVCLLRKEQDFYPTVTEEKLVKITADFLGRQLGD